MHSTASANHFQPAAETLSATTEISLEAVLSIWWSCTWRTMLAALAAAIVVGAAAGAMLGAIGHVDLAAPVGELLGWLVSIPANIWGLMVALRRPHLKRTIVLVRSQPAQQAIPAGSQDWR